MVSEGLPPGMEYGDHAGLGTKMLGVSADDAYGLGRRFEEDIVNDGLILKRNCCNRWWDGEYNMEIGDREELGIAIVDPSQSSEALAFWAMPIPATIVGNADGTAVPTLFGMATENCGATRLNCAHHAAVMVR
jgi:hypothetical protein